MNIFEPKKVVYTAQSKYYFYFKMIICQYVLNNDCVPLNPFNVWGYYLYELVDRDLVRRGNNNIVRIVDEVWIFGPISNGVLAEIEYAMKLRKPIRFFSTGNKLTDIKPIKISELVFEEDALIEKSEDEIKDIIMDYVSNNKFD